MTAQELVDELVATTREVEQALHCLEVEALDEAMARRQACVDALALLPADAISDALRQVLRQCLVDGDRIRRHAAARRDAAGSELAEIREAGRRLRAARSRPERARFLTTRA